MRTSESLDKLGAALAAASAAMPAIGKDRAATIPTKAGGSFSYRYADLADVLSAVRPALAAQGLSILQSARAEEGALLVATRILHASGQWVEADGPGVSLAGLDARGVGSAMTYARRYSLVAALGIAPDDDDDGAAAVSGRSNGRPANRGAGRGEAAPAVPDSAPSAAAAATPHASAHEPDPERAELLVQAAEIFGSRAGALRAARERFGQQVHAITDVTDEQLVALVAQGVLA